VNCQGLSQLTDFASLASALARFGKVGREATNQKVESSSRSNLPLPQLTQLFLNQSLQHFVAQVAQQTKNLDLLSRTIPAATLRLSATPNPHASKNPLSVKFLRTIWLALHCGKHLRRDRKVAVNHYRSLMY